MISTDEINALWAIKDNEYAKIILFYIYTGLRFSELRYADIHDNYIEVTDSKTPAGIRIVPICDKAKSLLPFTVPPRSTFYRRFKELLPDHTIHETRHTFTSMLAEKGVDVRIIKTLVGHKMDDVTAIYTHFSLDVLLEAVNKL